MRTAAMVLRGGARGNPGGAVPTPPRPRPAPGRPARGGGACPRVDEVPRLVPLGLEVEAVVLVRRDHVRDAAGHADAVALQLLDLLRVVGEQADRADRQAVQHVRGDRVVALVVAEPEREVGLDGVEPAVLQRVGAHLVEQADAAPLLAQVEQHAAGSCVAMARSATPSWSRQSQRSEPSASPVRHSECRRVTTSSRPSTSPCTIAMCSLPSRLFQKATMRKRPKRVGRSATATTFTQIGARRSPRSRGRPRPSGRRRSRRRSATRDAPFAVHGPAGSCSTRRAARASPDR